MREKLVLLALLLPFACGDNLELADSDTEGNPDAGLGQDPDTDGGTTPTASTECRLRTRAYGVTAVLHNADGSVNSTGTTDAGGAVSWDPCPDNALVTFAAHDEIEGWKGVTVAGVQPGDDIEVVLPELEWTTTLYAAIPEDGAVIEQVRLAAGGTCWASANEGESDEVSVTAGCVGQASNELSALAWGKNGGIPMYSYSNDNAVNSYGVTNVTDMSTWQTGGSVGVDVVGADTGLVLFSSEWMRNGLPYGGGSYAAVTEGGQASHSLPVPPSGFSTVRRIGVQTNGLSRGGYVKLSSEAVVSFDLASALPNMEDAVVDNSDDQRPVFTAVGLSTETDLAIFRVGWLGAEDEAVLWRLIVPSGSTNTVQFPELPSSLAAARPSAADISSVSAIDMSNASYKDILTSGYVIGQFLYECAELSGDAECWFTNLQTP